MSRMYGIIVASCLLLGSVPGADAQYVVEWPPQRATSPRSLRVIQPLGRWARQYMETFPTFTGSYDSTGAYMMQQAVPLSGTVRTGSRGQTQGPQSAGSQNVQSRLQPGTGRVRNAVAPGSALLARVVPGPRLHTL